MTLIQILLILLFGVPIVAACLVFFLGAMWMQIQEEVKANGQA